MTELQESLKKCPIKGNVVFLPSVSSGPLANYHEVRKTLLAAGAVYKKNTFVFNEDAKPIIEKLLAGETVNPKKEFQSFNTPDELADVVVGLAEIKNWADLEICEPSAGDGSLIRAIHRYVKLPIKVWGYELMQSNQNKLQTLQGFSLLGSDFLECNLKFDRIIANPPFTKNQDVQHIKKMYACLKEKGILVSIASISWISAEKGLGKKFREWLDDTNEVSNEEWRNFSGNGLLQKMEFTRNNGDCITLQIVEAGAFKQSGTMVKTVIVKIKKHNV